MSGRVAWRAVDYIAEMGNRNTGRDDARETMLDNMFPPGSDFPTPSANLPCLITKPTIILDADDQILAWYLLDIISQAARVSHFWRILLMPDCHDIGRRNG